MTQPFSDLSLAITNKIKGHHPLRMFRVYSVPTVPRTDPYVIAIEQNTINDWSWSDGNGYEHLITLHVWTNTPKPHSPESVLHTLRNLLQDADLSQGTTKTVLVRFLSLRIERDHKQRVFHGSILFRILSETPTS